MRKLILLLIVLTSNISWAQDTLKTTLLDSVQVVGIRGDIREPVSVTRFSTSKFNFINNQKDPFFVLDKVVPSIYAQSDNGDATGYSYMRMRGLDQTRINYNLNGIPLNEMEDQGLYFSNMPGFYNYVSNISVERGIGTSKYGNTSVAGSVNMETQSLTEKSLHLRGVVYSPTTHFYNGVYSSGLSKKGLYLQLGGSWITNKGFKEHSGNVGGSIYYNLGIVKKDNIVKLWGFSGWTTNQLAYLGVPMDSLQKNYRMNLNMESDKDTFNQNLVCLTWVNHKINDITFNTSGYFLNVNGHYSSFGTLYGVNSYQGGVMSNMTWESGDNRVVAGLNTNIYTRKHFGSDFSGFYFPVSDTVYSRYTNQGFKEDVIAYIKYTRQIGEFNFFLDLQGRYVHFNIVGQDWNKPQFNWLFCNPKVGFKWIKDYNQVYLSMGLTSREPTRSDLVQNVIQNSGLSGANADNATQFLTNQKLQPERVFDLEIGYSRKSQVWDFNLNGYLMNIRNEFAPNGLIDPGSGFMVKRALESTLRVGIETDAKVNWKGFSMFWAISGGWNRFWSGSMTGTIPFCPNVTAGGGISYSRWGATIGLVGNFTSQMAMNLDVNPSYSSSYALLSAYVNYQYKSWNIGLNMNNIFNQKYYIPAGIGYYDATGTFQSVPTYYVGKLFSPQLVIQYKL